MNQNHQHVHIIAIGGAVMSRLAVALQQKGMVVSGSDDHIDNPLAQFLQSHRLFPEILGWHPERINSKVEAVIVGMHAQADNPELLKAQALGLKIYSYPEYIRTHADDKQRIVIAGSHGKTTLTGIVAHVLDYWQRSFDLLMGAQVLGIPETIRFADAPIFIIEGDEYPASSLDSSPSFLKYDHHIALVTGTAWDHIDAYPTSAHYQNTFDQLASHTPKAGTFIYCKEDAYAEKIGSTLQGDDLTIIPYQTPKYTVKGGVYYLNENVPLKIFGRHNMQNIAGAQAILSCIGVSRAQFYEAIPSFEGIAQRTRLLAKNDSMAVYTDAAHAPVQLAATTQALKALDTKRKLTACYELHSHSSLNKDFLPNYKNTFHAPEQAILYVNKQLLEAKPYALPTLQEVQAAFQRNDIKVFTDSERMKDYLLEKPWKNENLIFMSSGNFGGIDLLSIARRITHQPL